MAKNTEGLKKLEIALKAAGMPYTRKWVWQKIHDGKLTLPKKAYALHQYDLSDETVEQAVQGLKTQGEYYWGAE